MNDYKELIEMLRSMSRTIIREDANDMNVPEENIWDAEANALADAADAIEQLVKEHDVITPNTIIIMNGNGEA